MTVSSAWARNRWRARGWVIAAASVSLVLSACTSAESGTPVADGALPSTTTTAPSDDADGDDTDNDDTAESVDFERIGAPDTESDASGLQLQDVWMLTDIRGVSDAGEVASVLDEVVAELALQAEQPVTLADNLEFAPLPELPGVFASPIGSIRDDVPVTFGLFRLPANVGDPNAAGRAALGLVTAAPDTVTNVEGGDQLVFDADQIDALAGHHAIVLDYVFGQAAPSDEVTSPGSDPIAVLAGRFAAGTMQWVGADPDHSGTLQPAMRRGVPGISDSAGVTAVQTASAGGGLLGFPIADAFSLGVGDAAFTAYCMAAGTAFTGGASLLLATAVCTSPDTASNLKTVSDAFDANNPCEACREKYAGDGIGSSVTGSHLTIFDRAWHANVSAGEFDMLVTDEMRVQTRMTPWESDGRVSVNSAVAIDVFGDVLVVDPERDAPESIIINGSAVPLAQSEGLTLAHDGKVFRRGNALVVEWPDGGTLAARVYAKSLDLYIAVPDDYPAAEGFFGNYDDEEVESWRVDEASSLFDPPLTHDSSAPKPGEPVGPGDQAWAEAVCSEAGLVDLFFDACVSDAGATGNLGFVTRLVDAQVVHRPGDLEFPDQSGPQVMVVDGAYLTDLPVLSDGAGHALVSLGSYDGYGYEVVALSTGETAADDGATADDAATTTDDAATTTDDAAATDEDIIDWRTPTTKDCGVAVGGDEADRWVAVPGADQVDNSYVEIVDVRAVHFLDPATGDLLRTATLPDESGTVCAEVAATASTVILRVSVGGAHLVGVDAASAKVVYEQELAGMVAGPVVAGDGSVWVLTKTGDKLAAHRIDPETGESARTVAVPGSKTRSAMVPTSDGFVVTMKAGKVESVVRVGDSGIAWQMDYPVVVEGKKYSAPTRLAADKAAVVGYSGSSVVISMDAATGEVLGRMKPSSFNNNGGHIALHNGAVVVGPFGGKHWVEAYDPSDQRLLFTMQKPPGPKVADVKRIDSIGSGGLVLQANLDDKNQPPGAVIVIVR